MLPNRRLIRADEAAEQLIGDLREILTFNGGDDTPLEELTLEALQSLENVRRRLRTFMGRKNDRRHDPKHQE